MSSYIAQIMCYACNQTMKAVYEQTSPSASEIDTYDLDGWSSSSWISLDTSWPKWVRFCGDRLYDGNTILAGTWTVGKHSTFKAYDEAGTYLPDKQCWISNYGTQPVIMGDDGVYKCEITNGTSVCGELWYFLSTGNKHDLCAGCSGSTPG